MAGEQILLIDDSAAVREIARKTLENEGYRVTVAGNGVSALLAPDFKQYDLVIVDAGLEGVDGLTTVRELKTDAEKHAAAVLLLVSELEVDDRENVDMGASNGYLLKPFEPDSLIRKARALLREKEIEEQCQAYLRAAAERYIGEMADKHVREAVESKSQLLTERAIQNVVTQIDQKARREVDQRVTVLTSEKEQELVRMTVHEVARSMVEKLAERKVADAMEAILHDSTEQAVRRTTDSLLPNMVRDRLRESMENILPREIELRVRQAADQMAPEISEKLVGIVSSTADRLIPKMARDKLPDLTQHHLNSASQKIVPRIVDDLVSKSVRARMSEMIDPLVLDAAKRIRRRARWAMIIMLILFLVYGLLLGAFAWRLWRSTTGDVALLQRDSISLTHMTET